MRSNLSSHFEDAAAHGFNIVFLRFIVQVRAVKRNVQLQERYCPTISVQKYSDKVRPCYGTKVHRKIIRVRESSAGWALPAARVLRRRRNDAEVGAVVARIAEHCRSMGKVVRSSGEQAAVLTNNAPVITRLYVGDGDGVETVEDAEVSSQWVICGTKSVFASNQSQRDIPYPGPSVRSDE